MLRPESYDLYHFNNKIGLITFTGNKVHQLSMPVHSEKEIAEITRNINPSISRKKSLLPKKLEAYFAGDNIEWSGTRVDLSSYTKFEREVLRAAMLINYGEVTTYKSLADNIGRPNSSRAVGNALGKNKTLILVPCHRVTGSNLSLGGFSQGLEWKKFMLGLERTGVNELKVKLGSK